MMEVFKNKGLLIQGIINLSPLETYELCQNKGAVLLDVREPYINNIRMFDLPNKLSIPLTQIKENSALVPEDVPIICADSTGLRSKEAVVFLQKAGYMNVANMAGGIVEWERDKLPVIVDIDEQITGGCMCVMKKGKEK